MMLVNSDGSLSNEEAKAYCEQINDLYNTIHNLKEPMRSKQIVWWHFFDPNYLPEYDA